MSKRPDSIPALRTKTTARLKFLPWLVVFLVAWLLPLNVPAAVLDKDRALAAQTFWDNRDWDWYKSNIAVDPIV